MSNEREILDPTPQCGDDGIGLDPVIVIVRSSLDPIAYLSRIPSPSSFLGSFVDGGDRYRDFIRRLLFGA